MRFMLMHKTNASNEAGLRPPEELIAGVGRTIREMQETGILRDGAGLAASSLGATRGLRDLEGYHPISTDEASAVGSREATR